MIKVVKKIGNFEVVSGFEFDDCPDFDVMENGNQIAYFPGDEGKKEALQNAIDYCNTATLLAGGSVSKKIENRLSEIKSKQDKSGADFYYSMKEVNGNKHYIEPETVLMRFRY